MDAVVAYQNFEPSSFPKKIPIGQGRFGTCYYTAHDHVFGPVAIKMFETYPEDKIQEHVNKQMRYSHHPNIIGYYGPIVEVETGDRIREIGYVMEYMRGGSLDKKIYTDDWINKPLEERFGTVLNWTKQAARALAYCHEHDWLFRDVQPKKMLLDETGNILKIGDFQLGRNPTNSGTANAVQERYRAPESFLDKPAYNDRTDVYSLAISIWEMLNGRYNPDSSDAHFARKVYSHHLRPSVIDLPQQMQQLLSSCWEHNQAIRPTMYDVISRVEEMERTMF